MTDGGIFKTALESDPTKRGESVSDPHAEPKIVSLAPLFFGEVAKEPRISIAILTALFEGSAHGSGSLKRIRKPSLHKADAERSRTHCPEFRRH